MTTLRQNGVLNTFMYACYLNEVIMTVNTARRTFGLVDVCIMVLLVVVIIVVFLVCVRGRGSTLDERDGRPL